jgi:hypothetical protein
MRENTNPLDNIRIASPCGADWDAMYGSDRKRFCSECRLNVYNISEMTQDEAENMILRSEGRLCLRVFKRKDGTVLTQDCPVGWKHVKRRISLVYKAAIGLASGFLAGMLGLGAMRTLAEFVQYPDPPPLPESTNGVTFGLYDGTVSNLPEIKNEIFKERKNKDERIAVQGRVEKMAGMGQSIHMDPFRTP